MNPKRLPLRCVHYCEGMCLQPTAPKFYACDKRLIETCRHYQERSPHCSQCVYYDNITTTMYCYKLQKRITARKRPCKNYSER